MNKKIKLVVTAFSGFVEILLISLAVFFVVYVFVGQMLTVSGDSMYPTFKDGEKILIEKITTKFEPLHKGEIVVFIRPKESERLIIKRVAGVPYDTFHIENGKVLINDNIIGDNLGNTFSEGENYTIPINKYFVLGDNQNNSSDSRSFGLIDKNTVIGRAFIVYYPLTSIRFLKN